MPTKLKLRRKIKERKEREGKQKREDQAVEQAVANAQIDIPEPMIDLQARQMADDFRTPHYAAGHEPGAVFPVYRPYRGKDDGRVQAAG